MKCDFRTLCEVLGDRLNFTHADIGSLAVPWNPSNIYRAKVKTSLVECQGFSEGGRGVYQFRQAVEEAISQTAEQLGGYADAACQKPQRWNNR